MKHQVITGNDFYHRWTGSKPVRIISLVPSLTEAFYYFDLGEQIVGITKFCELPHFKSPEPLKIGGTKNPNIKRILSLQPDVIFASKEENDQQDIEILSEACLVIVTDIKNLNDNMTFLTNTGMLFDKPELSDKINRELSSLYFNRVPDSIGSAVYIIWKEPFMTVGGDTFIHDMMKHAGLRNLYGNVNQYPVIDETGLRKDAPDYILLSSEPYPFKDMDVQIFSEKYPGSRVLLVDGQMFSWYGIRPLYAQEYFRNLLSI